MQASSSHGKALILSHLQAAIMCRWLCLPHRQCWRSISCIPSSSSIPACQLLLVVWHRWQCTGCPLALLEGTACL
jgi:hypothetical protein